MRRWRSWRTEVAGERGTASLEFITAGMILLVPLIYLILTLSQLQAAAMATQGAARQAARVFSTAPTLEQADASARLAFADALGDHGFTVDDGAMAIECDLGPAHCLDRQSIVTVTVHLTVTLPLVPPVLGLDQYASVPVQATATGLVSRFAGLR